MLVSDLSVVSQNLITHCVLLNYMSDTSHCLCYTLPCHYQKCVPKIKLSHTAASKAKTKVMYKNLIIYCFFYFILLVFLVVASLALDGLYRVDGCLLQSNSHPKWLRAKILLDTNDNVETK